MTTRTKKQAVDATAEEYYASYFGDYGKQFTRKIVKRVAQLIAQRLNKSAGKSKTPPRVVRAQVGALGFAETPTGGLTFEGACRLFVVRGSRPEQRLCAFAAEFDGNGKMLDLKVQDAA
jgi:hypothetical protein